jgi:hypothetical protein
MSLFSYNSAHVISTGFFARRSTFVTSGVIVVVLITGCAFNTYSQHVVKPIAKGSYLHYGQPRIEDNSMYIEEAFNQETGIIQHITNLVRDDNTKEEMMFSYTEEIPLYKDRHQFSFTVNCPIRRDFTGQGSGSGLGDTFINYRWMVFDKKDVVLMVPRLTLVVPTGDEERGMGDGAFGLQTTLAVTKRLSRKFTSHCNIGYTYLFNADRYFDLGGDIVHHQHDLPAANAGLSVVYNLFRGVNLMLEGIAVRETDVTASGSLVHNATFIVNPAFRFGFDIGKVQIVPGIGFPLTFLSGNLQSTGTFFYLSLEPDHTR